MELSWGNFLGVFNIRGTLKRGISHRKKEFFIEGARFPGII
jgi:hypothetical protein